MDDIGTIFMYLTGHKSIAHISRVSDKVSQASISINWRDTEKNA